MSKIRVFALLARSVAFVVRCVAKILMKKQCKKLQCRLLELSFFCSRNGVNDRIAVALLSAEDHRFFFHRGIDPVAMVRAVVLSALGRTQGGSTIEQQLVRTLVQDYQRTIGRKVKELLLASTVVDCLSKDEVITTYLSIAYFGEKVNGMNMAKLHLNLNTKSDETDEAYCTLMAHLKYPACMIGVDRLVRQRTNRARHILRRVTTKVSWVRDSRFQ